MSYNYLPLTPLETRSHEALQLLTPNSSLLTPLLLTPLLLTLNSLSLLTQN
ncbi:hypothetical protein OGM63_27885 [Plectonema radiosum NIES-515]|uniref:Uncharacterized protein n=1 Tax=Plectonema radiosum NIES-515 TaxID=2986073 RepID=A0ABT3B7T9_9CYAN|nr:hypothetical protein [Plectonema radiosum]MCV3217285.1 hypothetical protein [Plectonema radiosum NIES-515]